MSQKSKVSGVPKTEIRRPDWTSAQANEQAAQMLQAHLRQLVIEHGEGVVMTVTTGVVLGLTKRDPDKDKPIRDVVDQFAIASSVAVADLLAGDPRGAIMLEAVSAYVAEARQRQNPGAPPRAPGKGVRSSDVPVLEVIPGGQAEGEGEGEGEMRCPTCDGPAPGGECSTCSAGEGEGDPMKRAVEAYRRGERTEHGLRPEFDGPTPFDEGEGEGDDGEGDGEGEGEAEGEGEGEGKGEPLVPVTLPIFNPETLHFDGEATVDLPVSVAESMKLPSFDCAACGQPAQGNYSLDAGLVDEDAPEDAPPLPLCDKCGGPVDEGCPSLETVVRMILDRMVSKDDPCGGPYDGCPTPCPPDCSLAPGAPAGIAGVVASCPKDPECPHWFGDYCEREACDVHVDEECPLEECSHPGDEDGEDRECPCPAMVQEVHRRRAAERAASCPEGWLVCRGCGKPFDPAELDQVLFHEGDHRPVLATGVIGTKMHEGTLADALAGGLRRVDGQPLEAERLGDLERKALEEGEVVLPPLDLVAILPPGTDPVWVVGSDGTVQTVRIAPVDPVYSDPGLMGEPGPEREGKP